MCLSWAKGEDGGAVGIVGVYCLVVAVGWLTRGKGPASLCNHLFYVFSAPAVSLLVLITLGLMLDLGAPQYAGLRFGSCLSLVFSYWFSLAWRCYLFAVVTDAPLWCGVERHRNVGFGVLGDAGACCQSVACRQASAAWLGLVR